MSADVSVMRNELASHSWYNSPEVSVRLPRRCSPDAILGAGASKTSGSRLEEGGGEEEMIPRLLDLRGCMLWDILEAEVAKGIGPEEVDDLVGEPWRNSLEEDDVGCDVGDEGEEDLLADEAFVAASSSSGLHEVLRLLGDGRLREELGEDAATDLAEVARLLGVVRFESKPSLPASSSPPPSRPPL